MKVDRISASVRKSMEIPNGGGWRTVELGAEASLAPDDDWEECHGMLFVALSEEMAEKLPTPKKATVTAPDDPFDELEPAEAPKGEEWCQAHNVKMTQKENATGAWYSHKVGNDWCNGKAK